LEKEKTAKANKEARRRLDNAEEFKSPPSIFTWRNIGIVLAVVAGIVGFAIWRGRPRHIEVKVAPSSNPTASASNAPAPSGTTFTGELLDKLEWKQFEGLVSAYYSKTGVVATNTNAGPEAPVHIKISWKGEPRPFAYVRCIACPAGLVEAKAVQGLVTVLAAENIRRGHVVTSGKFIPAARELAAEKHITLMPGDVFLEKLNALPTAARVELLQTVGIRA
jgi:hypothetical protein